VVLRVENLSGAGFKDISLEARKGEIIGLTGLQGAGSSEFLQTLFGAMKADSGSVYVNGELIKPNSVKRTMKHSIGMIPANRKENSIIPEMCLTENTTIAEHELTMKKPFVKKRDESRRFNDYRDKLGIRCSSGKDLIISLSGGNQQKAIVARWLNTDCDILLLDNPTQGIDVGAKDEIYKLLITLAEAGKTILFNTLEVPEIMKVADRCFVFYHGRVEKVLSHNEINEETVIRYATNANKVRKGKEPSAVAA
jgi:ribose transport system ATP-binding protein